MNVLHVLGSLGVGGVETNLLYVTDALRAYGIETHVFAMTSGTLREEFERCCGSLRIAHRSRVAPLKLPQMVLQVSRFARELDAAVLSAPHLDASWVGALAGRRLNRPFVTHIQTAFGFSRRELVGFEGFPLRSRLLYQGLLQIPGLCQFHIAASAALASNLHRRGVSRRKIAVIPNAVSMDRPKSVRLSPSHPGVLRVLCVGRLVPQKNHRALLIALAAVVRRMPFHLQIVGDGPLRSALTELVANLGIEQHVEFTGIRRDVLELMDASDVLVLPSVWEINPVVTIEAMSRGLPVIATDVPGMREVIADGTTGILVPPGDTERLQRALCRVAEQPLIRNEMGCAARTLALSKYHPAIIASQLHDAYVTARARIGAGVVM